MFICKLREEPSTLKSSDTPLVTTRTDGHSRVTVTEHAPPLYVAHAVPIARKTAKSLSNDWWREACPSSTVVGEAQPRG